MLQKTMKNDLLAMFENTNQTNNSSSKNKQTNKQKKKNRLNIFLLYLSFQCGLLLFLSFLESKAKADIYFYNGNQWKIQCIRPLTS